ncbi:hypothetical protein Pmani_026303 [Petrolisthes manimaculis]|uniref:Uncharacterized protein n=1 Tax=Petrolisthes manimaculis TaxID=1843537 RepID=A0AAE1P694_9EUCA|nr:hypothetical protein Pmani_026303 [Petrolisthes manimaculis]
MDDSTLELCLATALIATNLLSLMHTRNMKKKKKARRHWVKPWMARKSKNVFNNLLKEMCLEDQQAFYDYHRMHRKNFAELLELVSPLIKKQDTKMRKAVSPAQRLSITLRYLATEEALLPLNETEAIEGHSGPFESEDVIADEPLPSTSAGSVARPIPLTRTHDEHAPLPNFGGRSR